MGLTDKVNLIPDDFDLTPLVGAELLQVCLGEYQIQLQFEKPDLSCHIEGGGKVSLESGDRSSELFHGKWTTSHGLEQLVGMPLTAWSRRSPNQFTLTFTSGAVLVFETQESQYEDFTVQLGPMGEGPFWVL